MHVKKVARMLSMKERVKRAREAKEVDVMEGRLRAWRAREARRAPW
jgi:hypothetical protein